ncbi:MAG: DUF1320 domain-containing protein [Nitrospiraceae bacterium]|nr:DUF1320 domain-containing protein [Nitrospiraceae bacterium]
MPYSQLTDLQNVLLGDSLIQLTDDEGLGAINQDRINEAIAEGDALIDGYCGAKYQVPFNPAPAVVRSLSVALAIHNLFARRVEEVPAVHENRYKDAIQRLKEIASGAMTLGIQPQPAVVEEPAANSQSVDSRVFTTGATGNNPDNPAPGQMNLDNY